MYEKVVKRPKMDIMRIRNVRFSNNDWFRVKMAATLGKIKISELVRRGALAEAESVIKRLKAEKEAKRVKVVAAAPDGAAAPELNQLLSKEIDVF